MRVCASSVPLASGLGLDITINDEQATVEDLVEAYAAASDDTSLYKEQRQFPNVMPHGSCLGCTHCCSRYSIFLSRLDVISLAAAEQVSPEQFQAYCTAFEPWKMDRVRLIDPARYCLRDDELGCTKYAHRPLVCRLFVCCPHTERAGRLISEVNRLAESELVDWRAGRVDPGNPFNDKSRYDQVMLRDCVGPELWAQLFRATSSLS